jgi:prepilin-type N-terminal cleavage/methylation domain-containing protein
MKKAFSLIELSIVILIIGILVAGVTQSSRLIAQFRLASARSMTNSSPIASMKNLVAWFETTSEKSFLDSETEVNSTISTWYDINPTATNKNNATQTTAGFRPTYIGNCMNSLPCLRFGGSTDDDYLSYDGTLLANSVYSVIIVEQRRDSKINNFFMGAIGSSVDNANLHLGYRSNTTLTLAQHGNDMDITIGSYSSPVPRFHTFVFNSSSGKYHYLNNSTTPTSKTDAGGLTALSSNNSASIGAMNTYFFDGDICEVIIFNRAITTEERTSIQAYLSKKWDIS